jgi:ParB/RepB/Spo0J family partition protein
MPLQLDDLAALDAPTLENSGQPLMLPVESIDEDPEQPRREFEDNRLEDLAETIRARGVRQPISVRPNLQAPGRWMLNFGARRLRASKMAGMAEIPAFIDTTADSYDQVIENEQREGLRPLELALFVQKRIALGDNQAEIAKRLGKSRQWVTLATALIEPPDWLLQAYREGRCRGTNELYDLRSAAHDHQGPAGGVPCNAGAPHGTRPGACGHHRAADSRRRRNRRRSRGRYSHADTAEERCITGCLSWCPHPLDIARWPDQVRSTRPRGVRGP